MRTSVVIGLFVLLVASAPLLAQEALDLDGALAVFQNDHVAVEYSDAGKAVLEDVIDVFLTTLGVTDALDQEDDDDVMAFEVPMDLKDVVNKLSQSYYTLANVFTADEDAQESLYVMGTNWGLKSLRMDPVFAQTEDEANFITAVRGANDIAALYWAASNWLRDAQKHPMQAIWDNVPERVQNMSERTLELDPGYIAGGSYRALGGYWSGLPIGRDLDKTLWYLCHVVSETVCDTCVDFDPAERVADADDYLENRTFIAEFYYMEKDMWEEAKTVLDTVLAEEIGDKYPLMNAYAQENARELLAEVEERL